MHLSIFISKNAEHAFFLYSVNLMLILISCPARKSRQKGDQYRRSLGNSTRLEVSDAPPPHSSFQIQAKRSHDYIASTVIKTLNCCIRINSHSLLWKLEDVRKPTQIQHFGSSLNFKELNGAKWDSFLPLLPTYTDQMSKQRKIVLK